MNRLFRDLAEHGPVLTSGAYGTELQARGLKPGESADAWNLLRPDEVQAVASAFVEAGARVIVANTFQANRFSLARCGLSGRVADVNRAGVALALGAAHGAASVFGAIGPAAGGTPEDVRAAVLQQAMALAEAGAHALLLETFTNPLDAALATRLAAATGRPVVTCLIPSGSFHALEVAMTLAAAGAAGIGLNCVTPDAMLPTCRALRKATDLPLWMKPSAGLPRREGESLVYDMTPEEFADGCMELVRAGADFIGGCCGAGPEHIKALAHRLEHG